MALRDPREIVREIFGNDAVTADKLMRISDALTQATVAVMDAQDEVNHWRKSFARIQTELKAVIAVVMARYRLPALELTSEEVARIPAGLELHVGDPSPRVRRYELKPGRQKRSSIETAVDAAMRKH